MSCSRDPPNLRRAYSYWQFFLPPLRSGGPDPQSRVGEPSPACCSIEQRTASRPPSSREPHHGLPERLKGVSLVGSRGVAQYDRSTEGNSSAQEPPTSSNFVFNPHGSVRLGSCFDSLGKVVNFDDEELSLFGGQGHWSKDVEPSLRKWPRGL
ncbi:hypothetical protein Nepgr_026692 [Nepenthes gracilis]|uniref:Uncharacterized protein n=1 Tax=Nepenthes gracilis TaxID=150966 RepID=A0AAD3T8U4_NEPGR|nr:hypothetical protein Nepgr_026692 [Nepenthes gracilis]